jgi:hypothetical protein
MKIPMSYVQLCVVPEGSNCDVRLWNGKVNQRLNSPEKADFTFGEHIRAHAPGQPIGKMSTPTEALPSL